MDESADPGSPLVVDADFVAEHGAWMLGLASKVLQDQQLAEDAVQDAFLTAHAKGDRFEGRASLRTWLYRVTLNAALAIRRKRAGDVHDIDELLPEFDDNACRVEAPWSSLKSAEEVLEQADLMAFVRRSVEALPESYRVCLQLRDFEELSVAEIAEMLEISEQNVKVRTHRARSALKRLLEPLLRGRPISEAMAVPLPRALSPGIGRRVKGLLMSYLPMMITCRQFEEFIMDYLEGVLPESRRRLFELHVRRCRECREYLAAYERARELASSTARLIGTLREVPKDLVEAVVTAL